MNEPRMVPPKHWQLIMAMKEAGFLVYAIPPVLIFMEP